MKYGLILLLAFVALALVVESQADLSGSSGGWSPPAGITRGSKEFCQHFCDYHSCGCVKQRGVWVPDWDLNAVSENDCTFVMRESVSSFYHGQGAKNRQPFSEQ